MLLNKVVASYVVVNENDVLTRNESVEELKFGKMWAKFFIIYTKLELSFVWTWSVLLQFNRIPKLGYKKNMHPDRVWNKVGKPERIVAHETGEIRWENQHSKWTAIDFPSELQVQMRDLKPIITNQKWATIEYFTVQ